MFLRFRDKITRKLCSMFLQEHRLRCKVWIVPFSVVFPPSSGQRQQEGAQMQLGVQISELWWLQRPAVDHLIWIPRYTSHVFTKSVNTHNSQPLLVTSQKEFLIHISVHSATRYACQYTLSQLGSFTLLLCDSMHFPSSRFLHDQTLSAVEKK